MQEDYYTSRLYPLQDRVLASLRSAGTGFYLTGGTALSRVYLNHRYSDDLDFFVNDAADFKAQVNRVLAGFKKDGLSLDIGARSDAFVRLNAESDGVLLKIDFVNDVAFHDGDVACHAGYGKVDGWRNILSNKICALGRLEAKDVADILFISLNFNFNWELIIAAAREKDLWVEPLEVSRLIGEFPVPRFTPIRWTRPVDISHWQPYLDRLAKDIFYGADNSLASVSPVGAG